MNTPSSPAVPPPQKRRGLGKTEKIVLGCALGCGGLLLIGFLLAASGFYWFVAPGEQIATERIVSPDAIGAIDVRRSIEDPGLSAMMTNFFLEVQKASREQQEMPPSLRWMQNMQGRPDQGLKMWMPKGLTLTVEPDAENEPAWVAAVNLRSFPRLIRTMIGMFNEDEGSGDVVTIPYGKYSIERMGNQEPIYLTFDGGTMLLAENLEVLERVLDRLGGDEATVDYPAAAASLGLPEDFGESWDITAVFANPDDLYGVVLEDWLNPESLEKAPKAVAPATESVRAFAVGVDAVTGDEVQAELRLAFDPEAPEAVAAWRAYLEQAFDGDAWRENDSPLRPTLTLSPSGANALVAQVTITGFEAWMRQLARGLEGHPVEAPEAPEDVEEAIPVEAE